MTERVKLVVHGLFHTPKDWEELMSWINAHSEDERLHLITAAMMAWNMAATMTGSNK